MTSGNYDPVGYKISAMQNWNHAAPKYHSDWASKNRGPFKSTAELVRAAEIKPGNAVLDIACGTGAVSRAVSQELGSDGWLVGIDFSRQFIVLEIQQFWKRQFARQAFQMFR